MAVVSAKVVVAKLRAVGEVTIKRKSIIILH